MTGNHHDLEVFCETFTLSDANPVKVFKCFTIEAEQVIVLVNAKRNIIEFIQEGGGVSRQISGLVITTSVTSRHTSVIFDMPTKFFGSLTESYLEIYNF